MLFRTTALAAAMGGLVLSAPGAVLAQQQAAVNDAALQDDWWTARQEFGADDSAGAIQRIDQEDIMGALRLVKQGKSATLGKLYASDIPMVGARNWKLTIPGTPSGGPFGSEGTVFHDEYVTTEIGQVSTQFDGPGHIGVHTSDGDYFYGKRKREDAYSRGPVGNVTGMGPLGTEHVAEHAYVCRGVLLDAAKHRGMERLPVPEGPDSPGIITADDVKAMVEAQGLEEIGEGDCVFVHTGHGDLWGTAEWPTLSAEEKAQRREEFGKGEPGFGITCG